jgi:hypothetical protein
MSGHVSISIFEFRIYITTDFVFRVFGCGGGDGKTA